MFSFYCGTRFTKSAQVTSPQPLGSGSFAFCFSNGTSLAFVPSGRIRVVLAFATGGVAPMRPIRPQTRFDARPWDFWRNHRSDLRPSDRLFKSVTNHG